MRNIESWENVWKLHYMNQHLSPRIVKDLKTLEWKFPLPAKEGDTVNNIFIYGEVGIGKTLLAARLFLHQIKTLYLNAGDIGKLKFESFPSLLASIRATYNNPNRSEQEVMGEYLNLDFLVLDDFFTVRPTDWVMDIIYYLINHRYEYLLPTVITSNYSLNELEELLHDQRITGRINRAYRVIEMKYDN